MSGMWIVLRLLFNQISNSIKIDDLIRDLFIFLHLIFDCVCVCDCSPSLEVKVATILYNLSTISETIQILAQYIPHFTALVVNEDSHLNSNQTKDLISAVLNIIVERE
jgi:hypothetical protein